MADPDSPAHGDYTAMTNNNSGDEIRQAHGLGVSIQQFSYGATQPASVGGMDQGSSVGGGGNDHATSSPRLPESSASHVNFHNQVNVDDGEDDEGSPGGMNGLGAGGAGSPHEEEVRLSPKELRESSSREPSRLYVEAMQNNVYPVPAAPGSAIHVQPAGGPHQIAADKVESAAEPPAVVIAFINRHSGGKTGKSMAEELTKVLGAERVFDLVTDKGPAKGLRLFKGTPNLRVVIGGGDGSINWVLSGMRAEGMTDVPAGCIPLGTGNDSSRAFGWGFKFPGARKVKKSVERMRNTRVEHFVRYDRWHAFAQYDQPVSEEFADGLPASLRPIHSEEDIPEFYRHPKAIALPPVPDEKLRKQLPDSASAPRPYRAAAIDRDAAIESYNVAAVPLEQRGDPSHREHVELRKPAPPVTGEVEAGGGAAPERERGPGRNFGGEFNNYLSWGIDAQIQNSFHEAREGCRACFCCRPCNMAWMGCFGAVNFLTCMGKTLDASVEVRDEEGQWVDVPLPPGLRSLVLLNTPTYAGGRRLWGRDHPRKAAKPRKWECVSSRQALDDGLFEIVGVYSTFHLGRIMISLDRGVRIAQVNEARITFRSQVHAQADGEPYLDRGNVTYHIRPLRPQLMMSRPDKMPKT